MTHYSFLVPRQEQHVQEYGQSPLHALANVNRSPKPLDIHVHREVEVGLVLTGEEQIHYGDAVRVCRPGDVWLCGTWEPHGWLKDRPNVRTVTLIFQPEFLGEQFLGELPWLTLFAVAPDSRPRIRSSKARSHVLGMGEMLYAEILDKPPDWESVVRLELVHLLTLLKREWGSGRPAASDHVRLSTLARIMPALTLTHTSLWRKTSVAEAASACGLSPSHFQGLFSRAMGMSFGQFNLRARLAFAANRVLNSDRSVSSIAAETGFTDDSHLHRRFRQQYHCTPKQYRASAPKVTRRRSRANETA